MNTQLHATCAALALVASVQAPAHAQDANTARGMAATCANCHSASASDRGSIPAIKEGDREALLQQLKEFKSGARPATVMHQLARGFSDAQLAQLATWFAAGEKR